MIRLLDCFSNGDREYFVKRRPLNGGAGTDTLNAIVTVLAADITAASAGMSNIEVVNIRAIDGDGTVATDAALFNASLTTGITEVNADRSNSNVTITGLEAGAAVGMIGNSGRGKWDCVVCIRHSFICSDN